MSDVTPRQKDILRCFANGLTRNQVAEQLSLSPGTVKTHTQNVRMRLGAKTTVHAIAIAFAGGMLGKEDMEG